MKYDEVLVLIGEMGPYQIKIMVLVALAIIPEALNSMITVFISAEMDSWCAVDDWSVSARNCTALPLRSPEYTDCIHRYRDAAIPIVDIVDGKQVYDKCEMYDIEYPREFSEDFFAGEFTNSTRACEDGWMYDQSQYISTISSEFNLVCDRKYLAMTTQSIFYFGYLIGSFLAGSVADIIGRYYTLFIAVTIDFLAGIALAFSPNIWFFCICRFFVGVANISIYLMSFVIATEIMGPSKRHIGGISTPMTFGFGSVVLALLAYLIRDWRLLQIVVACSLLPIYLLIPILPESARWLMANQKFDKTEKIIREIAKNNNTSHKLPDNLQENLMREHEEGTEGKKYTLLDVLRQPKLRIAAMILFFVWPATSLMYFGLSLNSAKFGSNPYVTFFLSGLVEIPATLLVIPLVSSPLGRKYTIIGSFLVGAIACFLATFASGTLLTTLAMVGKFCITMEFSAIYLYTAEIYPTTVRSIGIGASSTAARIGSILAPITLMLADHWEPLPLVIYGTCAIIGILLILIALPETKGKILTATLEEGEAFLADPNSKYAPVDVMEKNEVKL